MGTPLKKSARPAVALTTSGSTPAAVAPAQLTAQYEALRAQALGGSAAVAVPLGLALLRQRGLSAWLAVGSDLLRRDSIPTAPPALRADPAPVPAGVHAALVRTLATMALAACEEKGAS